MVQSKFHLDTLASESEMIPHFLDSILPSSNLLEQLRQLKKIKQILKDDSFLKLLANATSFKIICLKQILIGNKPKKGEKPT